MTQGRFRFGRNWKSFLSTVDPESIHAAQASLSRLFPQGQLQGRTFFDIGCGSGLSMLAAYRLGAAKVEGVDIDQDSVDASRTLLSRHVPTDRWIVSHVSVFDLTPNGSVHDVVHSWGVLHHTGNMWEAIAHAADIVAPGGWLALAIYRRTPLCGFWTIEKRIYASAPAPVQTLIRWLYKGFYILGLLATKRNPARYIAGYKSARGMDWHHDVHDWLGGYPYESSEPAEFCNFLERKGFTIEQVFEHPAAFYGLFGSHCDEIVARRAPNLPQAG